ncbi:TIGR03757 family integrating conjugative element protein [Gilliamella sp. ESL0250]|uniref:TIGR03757 family integrating conjugative element protein n=1 Tax=Gilliamella sp. ESL0250 TaxID=2705036 RepID=UPI0015804D44|nr:TIGR03757 family integrating conjugative element protein [Gilliamella sp. ESL0250]NUF49572.1 TIGR03757 family integrating conjugative element protein [Gilliamella sp. ESL0250]
MKRILGLIVFVSFQSIGADIYSIDVFVNHEQASRVKNCHDNCQIYDLDSTEVLLNSFFGELPSDIDDAYSVVEKKLNLPEWKTHEAQIIEAQKTITKAFYLGVKKYPAIVINEKNVIYGITDVARAVNDFMSNEDKR